MPSRIYETRDWSPGDGASDSRSGTRGDGDARRAIGSVAASSTSHQPSRVRRWGRRVRSDGRRRRARIDMSLRRTSPCRGSGRGVQSARIFVQRPRRSEDRALDAEAVRSAGDAGVRGMLPYGKAERFIRTSLREWAYAVPHESSAQRTAAMPIWVDTYNCRRPHSALKGIPPFERLNNLLGFDTFRSGTPGHSMAAFEGTRIRTASPAFTSSRVMSATGLSAPRRSIHAPRRNPQAARVFFAASALLGSST